MNTNDLAEEIRRLIDMLGSDDVDVWEKAAHRLEEIGEPAILPLTDALQSTADQEHLQAGILETLKIMSDMINDGYVVEVLLTLYPQTKHYLQSKIRDTLEWVEGAAVSPLIDALLGSKSVAIRELALSSLDSRHLRDDSRVLSAMIKALNDDERTIRADAADALGNIQNPTAVPHLLTRLDDKDSVVRASAANALGWIRDASAVSGLLERLKDKDAFVRASASWALGNIGDARAIPALLEVVKDKEPEVHENAIYAIAQMGDVSVAPLLLEALTSDNYWTRYHAVTGLGRLRYEAALPELRASLNDPSWVVRHQAAYAVGEMKDDIAVPRLIELTQDENHGVRWAAAIALGRIADERSVSALATLLPDKEWATDKERVGDAAANALEKIGTPEALAAIEAWQSKDSSD